MMISNKQLT